jgi:hypothetical protein
MDESEPRLRRRGMFVHVETPELDQIEHESAEGISIRRVPTRKPTHAVRMISESKSESHERARRDPLRSESATGSHRQARMSR